MNVLFDKGTPYPLRRSLRPHAVTLIEQLGWPETIKKVIYSAQQSKQDLLPLLRPTRNGASSKIYDNFTSQLWYYVPHIGRQFAYMQPK
jgi:hypothetical protein